MSAFAGPEGLRRPCSHSCKVRGEIFSASANSIWVRPVLPRASATSLGATFVTRAALPAFISLTDWSSLLPSSSARRVSLLIFQYSASLLLGPDLPSICFKCRGFDDGQHGCHCTSMTDLRKVSDEQAKSLTTLAA